MARRGFFAELQHQRAVAEREQQRAQLRAVKELQRQQRLAEQYRGRAQREAARADAAAQREAKKAYEESRQAETDTMNAAIELKLAEIDDILAATLQVDDYVDLEALRATIIHPEFDSPNLRVAAAPAPIPAPGPEPVYVAPEASGGVFGKRRDERQAALARDRFNRAHAEWRMEVQAFTRRQQEIAEHARSEQQRIESLAADRARYEADCRSRESEVASHNRDLDSLISGLRAGTTDAVEEYFSIVLRNSVYPEGIELGLEYDVDPTTREMTMYVDLPTPDELPSEKGFRWVKAKDEITPVAQTQKEQRDRYTRVVASIVLRTLHEIWESDRAGHVDTIALSAGVARPDPATGHDTRTMLVQLAVARLDFEHINLARVEPLEALQHLGAVVSKAPWALTPIPDASGVRHR